MNMTANIAPDWMTTSKVVKNEFWVKPRNLLVRIRWAVDETGRNSVIPSTSPRIMV